jgi:hypothetical protein
LPSRESGYHMRSLQDFPEESPLRQLCAMLISHEEVDVSTLTGVNSVPAYELKDW